MSIKILFKSRPSDVLYNPSRLNLVYLFFYSSFCSAKALLPGAEGFFSVFFGDNVIVFVQSLFSVFLSLLSSVFLLQPNFLLKNSFSERKK